MISKDIYSYYISYLKQYLLASMYKWIIKQIQCVKCICIRSYSAPHFPAFALNTGRYGVSLRIQSECGKMQTRITPNTDTSHTVMSTAKTVNRGAHHRKFEHTVTKIWTCVERKFWLSSMYILQKIKFSVKDFFSKCEQIRRKLLIWSHLLKKYLKVH